MTTIVILGSGIMGSALTVPLADNGHDVRLVGTFLDTEIIDSIKATGVHPGLRRKLPESVRAFVIRNSSLVQYEIRHGVTGSLHGFRRRRPKEPPSRP